MAATAFYLHTWISAITVEDGISSLPDVVVLTGIRSFELSTELAITVLCPLNGKTQAWIVIGVLLKP
jgi:hypothetical protein